MVHVTTGLLLLAGVGTFGVDGKVMYHRTRKTCLPKVSLLATSAGTNSSKTSIKYSAVSTSYTSRRSRSTSRSASSTRASGSSTRVSRSASSTKASSTKTSTIVSWSETGTRSSSSPEATSSGLPSGDVRLRMLFPVTNDDSWSTSTIVDNALPLNDDSLRVSKVTAATSHTVEKAPDGKLGMEAIFPQGSISPSQNPQGGFSFYAKGASDLTTAKEATFSYSVYFESGFDFNIGGKLPGIYGGDNENVALSCSGGNKAKGCFSLRLMWRAKGAAELYAYLPPGETGNDAICPGDCPYGASVGRGKFTWKTGQWNTVSERVKLNDIGKANGEVEVFFNGQSVISLTGVTMCLSSGCSMRGLQCQTFFGGHTKEWASPKKQSAWFADWSVAITRR